MAGLAQRRPTCSRGLLDINAQPFSGPSAPVRFKRQLTSVGPHAFVGNSNAAQSCALMAFELARKRRAVAAAAPNLDGGGARPRRRPEHHVGDIISFPLAGPRNALFVPLQRDKEAKSTNTLAGCVCLSYWLISCATARVRRAWQTSCRGARAREKEILR